MKHFEKMNLIDEMIYVCDMETYEMVYVNDYGRSIFGDYHNSDQTAKKCYEYIQNKSEPCDFCNNRNLKADGKCRCFRTMKNEYYLLKDTVIEMDNREYRMEMAVNVTDMDMSVSGLRHSLENERKLESCIRKLVKVGSFHEAVDAVLQQILDEFDGERSYIFEFDWENDVFSNTHERCAEGVIPEIDNLQKIPIESVWAWINLFNDKSAVFVNVEALKDEDNRRMEYEILNMQGIKNLIAVPILFNDRIQGFLGVDNPKKNNLDARFLEQVAYFIANEIQKQKLTQKLQDMSYTDTLTGLLNRNAYEERLKELDNAEFSSIGIAIIDMNSLKFLNDNFGHHYGDNKLAHLGSLIRKTFNDQLMYRISGDEFAVICINADFDEFCLKSAELKRILSEEENELASMGTIWDDGCVEIKQLISQAESLMYTEKRKYYQMHDIAGRRGRPLYINGLVDELIKEKYVVYLQPIMYAEDRTVYGAEALIRKIESDGTIVYPYEFIKILEKEKAISYIDFFVFENVCRLLKKWEKEGRQRITVSCNFSRITIDEPDFVEHVFKIFDETQVNCSQLTFEITESSNVVYTTKLADIMGRIKEKGIRFALDDMGTEYASLEMLKLKELDIAKFDRRIIQKLEPGSRAYMLIKHMVMLCHDMGMKCVAEGVETEEEFALAKEAGCDRIQGYLFDRPLRIEEYEDKYIPVSRQ